MLSIVIPAYKEDKYLPKLILSIKNQSFKDYEIIICTDNLSKTLINLIKKYNCRTARGGSPSVARNNGAKKARNDLLFLDADVTLPQDFLSSFIKKSSRYDITTCSVLADSDRFSHKLYYHSKNFLNKYNPISHCSGQCIYMKKKAFEFQHGYDESLVFGEEHDLAARAIKSGMKFKFLSDIYILNSPRRIIKEGFLGLTFKSLYSEIYRMFKPIKKKIFEYSYEHG